jgi:hypothetical protein
VELPPEDLLLKDIGPIPDAAGQIAPLRGIILLNFPTNEDQINSLKECNINLDKVIILQKKEK